MKRLVDVVVSAMALLVLSPVIAVVAVIVAVTMGRPVFFVQPRAGRDSRIFHIVKFRTMSSATDAEGRLLPGADRVTRVGRVLRSTSLDEIPQFWNVLRGDMSLVGPRPLLVDYLALYPAHHARRHEVRPGITGWAQVNGRNATTWADRLDMDVWYVDNHSMRLDLSIMWRTFSTVVTDRGVGTDGFALLPEYEG